MVLKWTFKYEPRQLKSKIGVVLDYCAHLHRKISFLGNMKGRSSMINVLIILLLYSRYQYEVISF